MTHGRKLSLIYIPSVLVRNCRFAAGGIDGFSTLLMKAIARFSSLLYSFHTSAPRSRTWNNGHHLGLRDFLFGANLFAGPHCPILCIFWGPRLHDRAPWIEGSWAGPWCKCTGSTRPALSWALAPCRRRRLMTQWLLHFRFKVVQSACQKNILYHLYANIPIYGMKIYQREEIIL